MQLSLPLLPPYSEYYVVYKVQCIRYSDTVRSILHLCHIAHNKHYSPAFPHAASHLIQCQPTLTRSLTHCSLSSSPTFPIPFYPPHSSILSFPSLPFPHLISSRLTSHHTKPILHQIFSGLSGTPTAGCIHHTALSYRTFRSLLLPNTSISFCSS